MRNKEQKENSVLVHGMEIVNTQNDYETTTEKLTDKEKQTCSVSFVKLLKFKQNKSKIVQKNFLKIIIKKISWKTHRS